MNLECLNDIITSNLAIHIDLTDLKSWDLNTGLTSFSLTKWSGAVSDNLNLLDFGLTGFDNGRTNIMWSGIEITPEDTLFSMYRVGYNVVENPIGYETSGVTVTTEYLPITAVTTGTSGNYFDLDGGYLQGFFKLEDYNYELLSARYGAGITIETLVYLYPDSQGIFYMMGARAEDKYNPYFSGETMTGDTTSGVTTSLGNFLDALEPYEELNPAFTSPETNMYSTVYREIPPLDNIKNNVIAFELTQDKKLAYKYVNADGLVVTNTSPAALTKLDYSTTPPTVVPITGWTMIAMVFTPDDILTTPFELECKPQRLGKLVFYVNGRSIWTIKEFPEFYFHGFTNDKEKQLGVPYSISWGGGSFGLAESWHYDYQTYIIYNGQDQNYVDTKFWVEPDPIPTECYDPVTGTTGSTLEGLSLSADSTTFTYVDNCNPDVEHPLTVLRIEYTGATGTTGGSENKYFIKFAQPISAISNRDYVVNLSVFLDGIFNNDGKISVLMYSDDVDVSVVSEIEYMFPLSNASLLADGALGLHPFPDRQEYEWSVDGILYYGVTGFPVNPAGNSFTYTNSNGNVSYAVTGEQTWLSLSSTFRTPDNSGQSEVYLGLLIESNEELISGGTIYVNDFVYTAPDILVQDERKSGLTIEQNFDYSFIGGIQKLRVYDRAFSSQEILHNALIEAKDDPTKNMIVSKGGRIIYQ